MSSVYSVETKSSWSPGGNGRTITNLPTDATIAGQVACCLGHTGEPWITRSKPSQLPWTNRIGYTPASR